MASAFDLDKPNADGSATLMTLEESIERYQSRVKLCLEALAHFAILNLSPSNYDMLTQKLRGVPWGALGTPNPEHPNRLRSTRRVMWTSTTRSSYSETIGEIYSTI